jgi:hypothetical protein
VGSNMHCHYCQRAGSIKPSLQYFHILSCSVLSNLPFFISFDKAYNSEKQANFLDLSLATENDLVTTKIYSKRDELNLIL